MFRHRDKSAPARNKTSTQVIQVCLAELSSSVRVQRQKARLQLVEAGPAVVPELIELLQQGNGYARLEAIKALAEIQDPSVAPWLVQGLQDEDVGVRCAAQEALISLEEAGLEPLLRALIGGSDSIWLREGARHVLCVLKERGCLTEPLIKVLITLEMSAAEVRVPCSAATAWEAQFGSE